MGKQTIKKDTFPQWALHVAARNTVLSDDPRTQICAMIYDLDTQEIVTAAVNHLSKGFTIKDLETEDKYKIMVHAERAAILGYFHKNRGVDRNIGMVATAACCTECARDIVEAGIKHVITSSKALEAMPTWAEEIAIGHRILSKAGITLHLVDNVGVDILISGNKTRI